MKIFLGKTIWLKWLKMQKKAFSRVGVKVWNEMPDKYKNLYLRNPSKKKQKELFSIF